MSISAEIPQRTQDPLPPGEIKAPFPTDGTRKEQGNAATPGNLDIVPVAGPPVPHAAGSHQISSPGGDVRISTSEDERQEAPGVIVHVAFVIATPPDVNPDAEQPQVQDISSRVRAFLRAQIFFPAQLEGFDL